MSSRPSTVFDPFSSSFRIDPYVEYARLRGEGPVLWNDFSAEGWPGHWIVTTYDEVTLALREKSLSKDIVEARKLGVTTGYESGGILADLMAHWVTVRDGDEHSRLRRQVNKPFSSRSVEGIRERVREQALKHFQPLSGLRRADLVQEFAGPLAAHVMGDLVGVTIDDRRTFASWVSALSDATDVDQRPEVLAKGEAAALEFCAFLRGALPGRAGHHPPAGEHLLADMQNDGVDEQETAAAVAFLLTAGYVNTVNLIANSIISLLTHPAELARLRADRSILTDAVNECSRHESPVQMVVRYAFEDVEVGGHAIPKGDRVIVLLGSANRDESQFPNAAELDISRNQTKHVAFGFGLHSCLGVALAKMTCESALGVLLDGTKELRLAERPEWQESVAMRGPERLVVEWDA